MEPILYKTNKKKVARMFGIFMAITPLAAIGAYFVPHILNYLVGPLVFLLIALVYMVLAISVTGLIAGCIRLFSNRFDLRIDKNGIQNNAVFGKQKLISWTDIEKITIVTHGLNEGLGIFLKDPQTYVNSFTGLKKQSVAMLHLKYGTPCVINIQALQANLHEVETQMQEFLKTYGNKLR